MNKPFINKNFIGKFLPGQNRVLTAAPLYLTFT